MKQVAILVSMVFALVVFSPTLAPAFKDWVGQKPDQNGLLKPKKPPKGKSETNPKTRWQYQPTKGWPLPADRATK